MQLIKYSIRWNSVIDIEAIHMAQKSMASKLLQNIESMVDPNASVEQQLAQMRAQMAALNELPKVIQQKLENVNRQINQISMKESMKREVYQEHRQVEIRKHNQGQSHIARITKPKHSVEITELEPDEKKKDCIEIRVTKPSLTEDELEMLRREELKRYLEEKVPNKSPSRHQVSPQPDQNTPSHRKPAYGLGLVTKERPLYLPGGRRWRISEYNEDQISEALTAQAEVIKGNAIGVNFKKFEKPPVPLDHLKHSEVLKAIHGIDEPLKKMQQL